MYGWFYNPITETLDRRVEGELILVMQYDPDSKFYVLFENSKKEVNFLKNLSGVDGCGKLITYGEIFLRDNYPLFNRLGAFYLDKKSLSEDSNGYFKVD